MTEQEKVIHKIAQFGGYVCKGCDCTKYTNCVHYNRAKALYDEVYNEAYAAGKKDAIIDFAQTVIKCLDYEPILQMAVKRVAFGKFGVEVEE